MFNLFHLEGVSAFHNGEYQKAKVFLLQAIAKNPETPESYFFLGKACFLCDEKDEAIVYLMLLLGIIWGCFISTQPNII